MYIPTLTTIRSIEPLRTIPVPTAPKWTISKGGRSRWKPIPHHELVGTFVELLRAAGVSDPYFEVDTLRDGAGLVGCIYADDGETMRARDVPGGGVRPCIGFRHSNDGREVLKVAYGGRVAVCTNGMFVGEFVTSRRHLEGLRIDEWLRPVVGEFTRKSKDIDAFSRRLARTKIDDDVAMRILLRAASEQLLPSAHLAQCWEEWLAPRHSAFEPRTAWSLYNAITEALKALSPAAQLAAGAALPALFSERRVEWAVYNAQHATMRRGHANRARLANRTPDNTPPSGPGAVFTAEATHPSAPNTPHEWALYPLSEIDPEDL